MKTYEVCLQLVVTRVYTVRAHDAEDAVERASERAVERDDVQEVNGRRAEETAAEAA